MSRFKTILLALLAGLIFLSLGLFLKGGRITRTAAPITETLPQDADMRLTGVRFTELSALGQKWTMQAKTLHYYRNQDVMVLDQAEGVMYGKNGPMHLTGNTCYYEKTAKKLRLVGRVVARDALGRVLTAEEIQYDLNTGIFTAPDYFELTGPQLDMAGHGLWVDTRAKTARVARQACLLIKPAEKPAAAVDGAS
jgi:LPS export ABC transporter protein LptC